MSYKDFQSAADLYKSTCEIADGIERSDDYTNKEKIVALLSMIVRGVAALEMSMSSMQEEIKLIQKTIADG